MGTLDDAIREHLELKRLRGGSDEELDEKEAEALGATAPSGDPEDGEVAPPEARRAPDAEEEAAAPTERDAAEPAHSATDAFDWDTGSSREEPPVPAPEVADGRFSERPEPLTDPEPPGRNGFRLEEPDDVLEQDLAEPDEVLPEESLEPERAAAGGQDEEPAEDFLEKTPDFLEETPEHDRLWFEQGPPKDFNFD